MKFTYLRNYFFRLTGSGIILVIFSLSTVAQLSGDRFINGDPLPDAPELATRGEYKVGVRTHEVIHRNQADILKSKDGITPLYDRNLKLEIWYPAVPSQGENELISYEESRGTEGNQRNPLIQFSFPGRAIRNAEPLTGSGPFPLIVVSYGYPGSRLLMTYLTENLASKGYVVVSIDHLESTYRDAGGFQSTLLNRSRDILFVLDQIADMGKKRATGFLSGMVDADNTGLIGYSMGGYGVLNAAGAGYSQQMLTMFGAMSGGSSAIEVLTAGNNEYQALYDKRIKAVVAFAPNSPPEESLRPGMPFDFYYHYAEPAWDQRRINNINQHFVTAFMGIYLKKEDYSKYLESVEDSGTGRVTGFRARTSVGLELLHALPGNQ